MADVIMPQMGESIAEGTVTKWLKNVGDRIERDEPLFEISTDKVDAEIPSPAAGVLREIRVPPGATVPVNSVVGLIAEEGDATAAAVPEAEAEPAEATPKVEPAEAPIPLPPPTSRPEPAAPPAATPPTIAPVEAPARPAPLPYIPPVAYQLEDDRPPDVPVFTLEKPRAGMTADELRQTRSSPVVRKIAAEHKVDIGKVEGTGIGGRVTKQDILGHIERKAPPGPAPVAAPSPAAPTAPGPVASRPAGAGGPRIEIIPMSPIRKKTAEHMILSKRTSAHVSTFFEIDMTRVDDLRRAHRQAWQERNGVKLTFMPFILKAVVDALKAFPIVNARVEGESIAYHQDINLGVAVALDWGLIVPVIHRADEKNLLGLARAVNDLAERARSKKLKVEEVQGGTFTITNPGVFGSLSGTPIINQPQVAILDVGAIEKRPVVRDDAIAIRTMAYFSLTFDHRIVDGADADRFMAHVKTTLQEFDDQTFRG
ncbi:MAG: dihydrolipoamide acetyltransferase family protein [Acidobacteriota bacterium]|jgi:2-oxoglutarate dehydrogenase E2 component (dihydrolipoamide succinyltransferase)